MKNKKIRAIFVGKGHHRINYGHTGDVVETEFDSSMSHIQFQADGIKETLVIAKSDVYIPS